MNTILLTLIMLLGTTEEPTSSRESRELLDAMNFETELFASLNTITSKKVIIYDVDGDEVSTYPLESWIKNELSLDTEKEILDADLLLEYQGDLFYLKS